MPSATRFLGAPEASADEVSRQVSEMMRNRNYDSVWMVTTIADDLSLDPIAKGLRDVRFRRGRSEAIITTTPGGSGAENLLQAVKLIDEPYAFLEPSAHLTGVFFCVAQGRDTASVAVGPPGFVHRPGRGARVHESVLLLELDLEDEGDAALLAGMRKHFENLLSRRAQCRPMTVELVPDLVAAADRPVVPPADRRATGERSGVTAFYKCLSKNDVSWKDSPGQIIIPRKFMSFFDELTHGSDRSAGGGSRQRHREFSLTFRDGEQVIEVDSARVVLYVPADDHPRRNPEMRFTFRSSEILGRLTAGDYLIFRRLDGDRVEVERRGPDWSPEGAGGSRRSGELKE